MLSLRFNREKDNFVARFALRAEFCCLRFFVSWLLLSSSSKVSLWLATVT